MRRSRHSLYRLHDVTLAVALTAIGLAWVRAEWEPIRQRAGGIPGWSLQGPSYAPSPWSGQSAGMVRRWSALPANPIGNSPFYRSTRSVVATALYVMTGVACPWMVYLLYRARRPGRTWRFGRVRRPGAVACLAATVVLPFELIHVTLAPTRFLQTNVWYQGDVQQAQVRHFSRYPWPRGDIEGPFFTMLDGMPRHAGLLVAGSWLVLILTGTWRPERSWLDRAGRVLGWFWILAALHFLLFPA